MRRPSGDVGSTTSVVIWEPTPLSANPAPDAVVRCRAIITLLTHVPLIVTVADVAVGQVPPASKLDVIVWAAAGVDIISLTLPMPPADAAAKAAAALMLPMPPPRDGGRTPPSPSVVSSAEGEDKEDEERLTAATKRTLPGSSLDDDDAKQILHQKPARIIRLMSLTLTHTHHGDHGAVAVAESPVLRQLLTSLLSSLPRSRRSIRNPAIVDTFVTGRHPLLPTFAILCHVSLVLAVHHLCASVDG